VLVERGNRIGGLTEAGRGLLPRAERILAEVHDAGEEIAAHTRLGRGTVRLGCALQTLLEGRLARLLARFMPPTRASGSCCTRPTPSRCSSCSPHA